MDLRRIRYFLALVRTLDFSLAARGLGITQPALTKAMNRLEAETGGRLIRREGRRTHLTPLGEALLERFAELDRIAGETEEAARRLVGGVGACLRIGVAATVGPGRLVGLVGRFRERCPETAVSIHGVDDERELHEALLRGRLDCAFDASADADEPRLHRIRLYDEPFVLVLPRAPTAEATAPVSIADARAAAGGCTCADRRGVAGTVAAGAGAGTSIVGTGSGALSSERDDWTEALVGAGLGTGVMPRDSVGRGDVRIRPLDGVAPRTISLAVPSGHEDHAAIRRFVELARRFAADGGA